MQCLQRTIKCMNKNIYANDRGRVNNLPWEYNHVFTYCGVFSLSSSHTPSKKKKQKKKETEMQKYCIFFSFTRHNRSERHVSRSATATKMILLLEHHRAQQKEQQFSLSVQLFISFTMLLLSYCLAALIWNYVQHCCLALHYADRKCIERDVVVFLLPLYFFSSLDIISYFRFDVSLIYVA